MPVFSTRLSGRKSASAAYCSPEPEGLTSPLLICPMGLIKDQPYRFLWVIIDTSQVLINS